MTLYNVTVRGEVHQVKATACGVDDDGLVFYAGTERFHIALAPREVARVEVDGTTYYIGNVPITKRDRVA